MKPGNLPVKTGDGANSCSAEGALRDKRRTEIVCPIGLFLSGGLLFLLWIKGYSQASSYRRGLLIFYYKEVIIR